MLTDEIKDQIRSSYKTFLDNKGLLPRRGQQKMIAEFSKAVGAIPMDDEGLRIDSYHDHIVVAEAGTGTGKTLSYLIPGIILAKEKNKKLVIATATVALQEQIMTKDIPDLLKNSGMQFSYSLIKGRGRYLCFTKLNDLVQEKKRKESPLASFLDESEMLTKSDTQKYAKVLSLYNDKEWSGDVDSLPVKLTDKEWSVIANDRHQCIGRVCPSYSSCSYFVEKAKASDTDCLVANHDIVLADLSLGGGRLLPDPSGTIYVFDEAHHLPSKCLDHFASNLRLNSTKKWLDSLDSATSLLSAVFEKEKLIVDNLEKIKESLPSIKKNLNLLVIAMDEYALKFAKNKDVSYHVFPGGQIPSDIFELSKNIHSNMCVVTPSLSKIKDKITKFAEDGDHFFEREELEASYATTSSLYSRSESIGSLFLDYCTIDNKSLPPVARWIEPVFSEGALDLKICASPISAADQLGRSLWSRAFSTVLVSATLRVMGSFSKFKESSGIHTGSFHNVESPFDFSRGVLYIPANAVEANNSDAHLHTLKDSIPEIIAENDNGKLMLFSSWKQMNEVYESLSDENKSLVLKQGDHTKSEIISLHKSRVDSGKGSAIFGLSSFAEGVDLPGKYCKHVVITKLPFAVPDNPIEQTRSDWIEKNGKNPFMEISVPDAAIKLVQYAGRLIRTESDDGTITIFDRRLITKRYGQSLINSLPPYSRRFS